MCRSGLPSLEHADFPFLAPYDVAVPPQLAGRHVQNDLVGNTYWAGDLEGRAAGNAQVVERRSSIRMYLPLTSLYSMKIDLKTSPWSETNR